MKAKKTISNVLDLSKRFIKNHLGIISVLIISGIVFVGVFRVTMPVNMANLGGSHSWLSGSTIKFVNNWLEEGALNLNFTNYENPASIEFENLNDREPYLSYPSGETFFVYSAARLTGRKQISISFLHRFQIIAFAFEVLLLSSFVYLFLKRTAKIKNEPIKVVIAVFSGLLWMLLPACLYYLSNIYFADQCVILWTMGLTLIEYIIRTSDKNSNWLKLLRAFILYFGILIDYYFWILAFLFFVAEFIDVFLKYKKGERKKELWSVLLWFGIPAILGVLTYFWQLTRTEGWFGYLADKYSIRVAGKEDSPDWIRDTIFYNFEQAFSLGNGTIWYLITLVVIGLIGGLAILVKRKSFSKIIKSPGASIVISNILAIVLQIIIFKQHSAIHEFSMIKVGWIVAILPIILSLECYSLLKGGVSRGARGKQEKNLLTVFSLCFLLVFFAVGLPISEENYRSQRMSAKDYSFEYAVLENTSYEDVVFSYSKEILANPPQSLAISKKRVYKIKDVSEIENNMPGSDLARIVIIDKKDAKHDEKIEDQIDCLKKNFETKTIDDKYYLIMLKKDYEKCKR